MGRQKKGKGQEEGKGKGKGIRGRPKAEGNSGKGVVRVPTPEGSFRAFEFAAISTTFSILAGGGPGGGAGRGGLRSEAGGRGGAVEGP